MKKKTTWHKATEIKFRTPKEAKEKNTFSAIDIQRGREMTPAEVKAMKENPINEEHVCSDIFDKNLNCLIQTFYAGTPEGKRDLLRHGLFNQIMESKEISDLAKLAAGLFSRGMWFKTWFENNHKSIDYNFLYCFSDWCVKIGVIKTLVINNLPLTAGMKIKIGQIEGGIKNASRTKKSDPVKMKAFIDEYFRKNTTNLLKPSFTQAAKACAKAFNCGLDNVRDTVPNTYTNRNKPS